eukprot:GHVU01017559.1.p2 GENE.GHVU01017559.1~~GHVU01017559.1.p2  ORF type:complete len:139 (+),score=7.23 GHVU01017559.1:61-477(+)
MLGFSEATLLKCSSRDSSSRDSSSSSFSPNVGISSYVSLFIRSAEVVALQVAGKLEERCRRSSVSGRCAGGTTLVSSFSSNSIRHADRPQILYEHVTSIDPVRQCHCQWLPRTLISWPSAQQRYWQYHIARAAYSGVE